MSLLPSPTPPAFRNQPTHIDRRNASENELWDLLSNSVFFTHADPNHAVGAGANYTYLALVVGTPVAARYEIQGQAVIEVPVTANAFLRIKVDGVIQTTAISRIVLASAGTFTLNICAIVADVIAGRHTIELYVESVAGAFTARDSSLVVRRGRKPTV